MLKQLLKDKNISQKELSEKAGVDKINLNRIINGKNINVRKSTLEKLALALRVEPDYLDRLIKGKSKYISKTSDRQTLNDTIISIPFKVCSPSISTNGSQYLSTIQNESISLLSSTIPSEYAIDELFAINVLSENNAPDLLINDTLIINPKPVALNPNKIYLIYSNKDSSEIIFSRLITNTMGRISIKSLSDWEGKTIISPLELQKIFIGEVIYLSRKY